MSLLRTFQKGPEPRPEAISQIAKTSFRGGVLLLLAFGLSGCATPALWKHTAARSWAPVPSSAQFFITGADMQRDVIVVFRQSADVGEKLAYRLVAWNPCCPQSALAIGGAAVRQLTNSAARVQRLNCFPEDAVLADAISTADGYVFSGPGYGQFTLHIDGVATGPFDFPSNRQEPRLVRRFTILPFAVATDAAIIAAACCAGAGAGAGYGGGPIGHW